MTEENTKEPFVDQEAPEKPTETEPTLGFCLTLLPSFIMGTGYAFGESTVLGYLKSFPKDLVGGWSSGTGLSGLIWELLNLLVKLFDVELKNLYIGVSPICFLYFVFFFIVDNLKKKYDQEIMNGTILGPLAPHDP